MQALAGFILVRVDGFFLSLSLNKTITQSIMATALSQLEPTLRERPPPMVPLTREHGQRQRSFSTYLVTSNEASEPSSPIRTSSITIHSDREPHSFNRSWHDPHRSIPPSMPTLPECPRAELITTGDSVASSGTFDQEAPSQSSEEECPQSGKHKPSLQFSSLKHTRLPKQKLCRCLSLPSEQPRDKSSPMRLLTSPLHAVASLPDMKIPGRKLKRKATVAQRVDRSPSTDLSTNQQSQHRGNGAMQKKNSASVARTYPYEAPYFFPTPASPEAYGYVHKVRVNSQSYT